MAFINSLAGVKNGAANLVPTDLGAGLGPVNDQATRALAAQQALVQALQAANGVGNQSAVFNQLQGVANGTGPNPAQAELAQATGANTANQAALMAGQRGASANVGLIARQAAQQGGALQQNAAGQAATLQANQSLGALNQLAGVAQNQVGNQAAATAGFNNAAQNEQNQMFNAIGNYNNQLLGGQNSVNQAASGLTGAIAGAAGQAVGGGGAGLVKAAAPSPAATPAYSGPSGPENMAQGGVVSKGPKSFVGKHLSKAGKAEIPVKGEMLAAEGKVVPGKAKVKGNSYANDTVPAMLSPKEIVLPRSVTMSDDPVGNSAKFVAAVLAKQGLKRK